MDSLTQCVLGAAVAEAGLGKKLGNKAPLWGLAVGTLPDLDFIPGQLYSPIEQLLFHRGASHSIAFALIAGAGLSWVCTKIHRKSDCSFREVYITMFLILFTHALLDACTTWGTSLFWPLAQTRVSLGCISIIDPLYTLPLLFALITIPFMKRDGRMRRISNGTGLLLSSMYLLVSIANQELMKLKIEKELQVAQVNYSEIQVRPTLFNTLLWQITVIKEDGYLVGVRSWLDQNKETTFTQIPQQAHLIHEWRGHSDLELLLKITENQFAIEKQGEEIFIHDLRFGRIGFDESARFVFSYRLVIDSEGKLLAVLPVEKNFEDSRKRLHELWRRIWNT